MSRLLALSRITRVAGMTSYLLPGLLLRQKLYPYNHHYWSDYYKKRWADEFVKIIGAKLTVEGAPPKTGSYIYVCNHRSFADIPILLSLVKCSMLSKAEVANYPIIGPAATAVGTIYVQREERNSRAQSLQVIAEHLAKGRSALLFPEGTTSPLAAMREWKPGIFLMAAKNNCPIVPVAIEYSDPRDQWDDADDVTAHFIKATSKSHIYTKIAFHEPIQLNKASELKEAAEKVVQKTLERWHNKPITILPARSKDG